MGIKKDTELRDPWMPPKPQDLAADPPKSQATDVVQWWMDLAHREIERTIPKAVEYGSSDLSEIGRTMANAMGMDELDSAAAAELGCYFYLVGKVARWTDAIRSGRQVSDDTLFDIGVYVRMVQRIRAKGGWPGVQ